MNILSSDTYTVTTANTQYARAIATPEAAESFRGSDILLLQEVLTTDKPTIERNLGEIGLRLAGMHAESGLAIAISDRFEEESSRFYTLQPRSKSADTLESFGFNPRLRARGLLVTRLVDAQSQVITVATAHPIVCVRPFSRARQVQAMGEFIHAKHSVGTFILGADMNHYPGPNEADKKMFKKARITPVSTTAPTCMLTETKHGWLQNIGLPDARLDTLGFRKLNEISSKTLKIDSDHRALQATFSFI